VSNAVLLCGGFGSRLMPATNHYNKALIPLNEHFVIDYPINTLVKMGIKHITVILGGDHFADIVSYLKDGEQFGVEINFVYQKEANGIAAAINLAKPYVEHEESFTVLLGDNIYSEPIKWSDKYADGFAQIALAVSSDLNRFGVASIDHEHNDRIVKIDEKPKTLDDSFSHYAISGCYKFNRDYFSMFKRLKKSQRNEFEIVGILQQYLDRKELLHTFVNGVWADAGTWESIATIRKLIEIGRIKI
jgi:glucose-1-phosphate thymidylyltransferase